MADELPGDHLGRYVAERSSRPATLPTVLSAGKAGRVIAALPMGSTPRLVAELLYGAGLRVMECFMLRIRDLDLDRAQIAVRGGKGNKDRSVMLPAALRDTLRLAR